MESTRQTVGLIVGCGNMGRIHRAAAIALGARISGVVDPAAVPEDDGAVVAYSRLSELPEPAYPDFAVIATPTDQHMTALREVLDRFPYLRGVLLEKPPVRTVAELTQLRALVRTFPQIFVAEVEHYNPLLRPYLQWRGQPSLIRFERVINLGYFLQGTKPWFLDEARSGGIVLDVMVHDLNLLVAKYGRPEAIEHVERERRHYDIDDNVRVRLRYPDFTAELVGSWTSDTTKLPIRLAISIRAEDGDETRVNCHNYAETLGADDNPYYLQMAAFLSSIEDGRLPVPLISYLDATELAMRIAAA